MSKASYRSDRHYSTKKGVKSGGRITLGVGENERVESFSVRFRQFRCLDFSNSKNFQNSYIFNIGTENALIVGISIILFLKAPLV